MIQMNWHSLFRAAIFLGNADLVSGIVGALIFGYFSQTQNRVARYKKDWAPMQNTPATGAEKKLPR